MDQVLHEPFLLKADQRSARSREVRKFSVAFACGSVNQEVQFGWNEVSGLNGTPMSAPSAEQVVCSGLGMAGCPVRKSISGTSGWEQCPRMQRLASRLCNAFTLTHEP